MGEAFLMRRGGGRSVAVGQTALVCVKFPAGSACACTMGARTLTAGSAPGLAAFSVPEAGTWTVAITDGERTADTTVTVAEGDIRIVTLAYPGEELVILSPEEGLADGYAAAQGASVGGNSVTVNGSGGYLTPAVDLTGYSTLTVVCQTTYMQTQNPSVIFVDPDASKYSNYNANFALSKRCDADTAEHTYTLDVSALSGQHYIGEAASSTTFVFKSIVLS